MIQARHIVEPAGNFEAVVLQDDDGFAFSIQRSLQVDESDHALGMATYCLVSDGGACHYGGVTQWSREQGDLVALTLTQEAADALAVPTEFDLQFGEGVLDEIDPIACRLLSRYAAGRPPMRAEECETRKPVFKGLAAVVGPVEKVTHYFDEPEENTVDIASFVDLPEDGLVTYSTVTVHGVRNEMDGNDIPTELLVIARAADGALVDVLIEAAFAVGVDAWLAAPGVVFPSAVQQYFPDTSTPHLMWQETFVWPELGALEVPEFGKVYFLTGIPLTTAEVDFMHAQGYDALQDALSAADVPYTDLRRASVV